VGARRSLSARSRIHEVVVLGDQILEELASVRSEAGGEGFIEGIRPDPRMVLRKGLEIVAETLDEILAQVERQR
jgi:hypothetical protein